MPLTTPEYTIFGAAGLACWLLYLKQSKADSHASSLPLPPGPPRWPILGSLLSLPDSSEPNWHWFAQWAHQTASDVIYFRVLGSDTIVLNTREAATELLERRSAIYSDRPHMVMARELMGWNRMLGMADYLEGTKIIRKYMHNSMGAKTMPDWRPQQEQEAFRFLQKLLRSPENLLSHIRHAAGATVVRLTYGYTPKDEDDEYIKIAEAVMDHFSLATTPGAFMVDIFPSLRYVPWAPFKRTAKQWHDKLSELISIPMDFVHNQRQQGIAEPSFVSKWLEEPGRESDRAFIPSTAASLYAGGADTTVSAISTFFLAMLHYPETQEKAQQEIDKVIGKDRLPNFTDRASLPYVEALYKEVIRWQPVAPIGVPHRLGSELDDEYKGMRIPANAMVISNIWSMLRDPKVYQKPEAFNPSRFFGTSMESDPEEVAFGFGRRRCPGIAVAHSSVWLSIALTLAAYNIAPLTGEDGKPILPSLEYSNTTVSHPKPFQCQITPRSDKMRKTIEDLLI
ncbi:unnamed protein product [Rhizoctonia solani]|uniref:O-methylsterigmatocystin oxidoreductase n=1 Tax=Rhizoctonia solani TaxID=456999 RepID=A0A8H3CJ09_9AGAM|nr:unnamed protein product [Rhizoctonia solani]